MRIARIHSSPVSSEPAMLLTAYGAPLSTIGGTREGAVTTDILFILPITLLTHGIVYRFKLLVKFYNSVTIGGIPL